MASMTIRSVQFAIDPLQPSGEASAGSPPPANEALSIKLWRIRTQSQGQPGSADPAFGCVDWFLYPTSAPAEKQIGAGDPGTGE